MKRASTKISGVGQAKRRKIQQDINGNKSKRKRLIVKFAVNKENIGKKFNKKHCIHSCRSCDRTFASKGIRDVHMKRCMKETPKPMKLKDKRREKLTTEQKSKQVSPSVKPDVGLSKLPMDTCKSSDVSTMAPQSTTKIVMTTNELKRYLRTKDKSKCPVCRKLFEGERGGAFVEHLRSHTNQVWHACDVCSMKFRRNYDMKRHKRRRHSQLNPDNYKMSSIDQTIDFVIRKNVRSFSDRGDDLIQDTIESVIKKFCKDRRRRPLGSINNEAVRKSTGSVDKVIDWVIKQSSVKPSVNSLKAAAVNSYNETIDEVIAKSVQPSISKSISTTKSVQTIMRQSTERTGRSVVQHSMQKSMVITKQLTRKRQSNDEVIHSASVVDHEIVKQVIVKSRPESRQTGCSIDRIIDAVINKSVDKCNKLLTVKARPSTSDRVRQSIDSKQLFNSSSSNFRLVKSPNKSAQSSVDRTIDDVIKESINHVNRLNRRTAKSHASPPIDRKITRKSVTLTESSDKTSMKSPLDKFYKSNLIDRTIDDVIKKSIDQSIEKRLTRSQVQVASADKFLIDSAVIVNNSNSIDRTIEEVIKKFVDNESTPKRSNRKQLSLSKDIMVANTSPSITDRKVTSTPKVKINKSSLTISSLDQTIEEVIRNSVSQEPVVEQSTMTTKRSTRNQLRRTSDVEQVNISINSSKTVTSTSSPVKSAPNGRRNQLNQSSSTITQTINDVIEESVSVFGDSQRSTTLIARKLSRTSAQNQVITTTTTSVTSTVNGRTNQTANKSNGSSVDQTIDEVIKASNNKGSDESTLIARRSTLNSSLISSQNAIDINKSVAINSVDQTINDVIKDSIDRVDNKSIVKINGRLNNIDKSVSTIDQTINEVTQNCDLVGGRCLRRSTRNQQQQSTSPSVDHRIIPFADKQKVVTPKTASVESIDWINKPVDETTQKTTDVIQMSDCEQKCSVVMTRLRENQVRQISDEEVKGPTVTTTDIKSNESGEKSVRMLKSKLGDQSIYADEIVESKLVKTTDFENFPDVARERFSDSFYRTVERLIEQLSSGEDGGTSTKRYNRNQSIDDQQIRQVEMERCVSRIEILENQTDEISSRSRSTDCSTNKQPTHSPGRSLRQRSCVDTKMSVKTLEARSKGKLVDGWVEGDTSTVTESSEKSAFKNLRTSPNRPCRNRRPVGEVKSESQIKKSTPKKSINLRSTKRSTEKASRKLSDKDESVNRRVLRRRSSSAKNEPKDKSVYDFDDQQESVQSIEPTTKFRKSCVSSRETINFRMDGESISGIVATMYKQSTEESTDDRIFDQTVERKTVSKSRTFFSSVRNEDGSIDQLMRNVKNMGSKKSITTNKSHQRNSRRSKSTAATNQANMESKRTCPGSVEESINSVVVQSTADNQNRSIDSTVDPVLGQKSVQSRQLVTKKVIPTKKLIKRAVGVSGKPPASEDQLIVENDNANCRPIISINKEKAKLSVNNQINQQSTDFSLHRNKMNIEHSVDTSRSNKRPAEVQSALDDSLSKRPKFLDDQQSLDSNNLINNNFERNFGDCCLSQESFVRNVELVRRQAIGGPSVLGQKGNSVVRKLPPGNISRTGFHSKYKFHCLLRSERRAALQS